MTQVGPLVGHMVAMLKTDNTIYLDSKTTSQVKCQDIEDGLVQEVLTCLNVYGKPSLYTVGDALSNIAD